MGVDKSRYLHIGVLAFQLHVIYPEANVGTNK
jgi:hypothetical protein